MKREKREGKGEEGENCERKVKGDGEMARIVEGKGKKRARRGDGKGQERGGKGKERGRRGEGNGKK